MNIKNLFIASLVGGIVISSLANFPFLNLINRLLYIGFWGGALLAAYLYRWLTGSMTIGQGIATGAFAGLFAAVFSFTLRLVGLAGAPGIFFMLIRYLQASTVINLITRSATAMAFYSLFGAIFDIACGTIGGLIGGALFRTRAQAV